MIDPPETPAEERDNSPYDENGVDLSLVRWMLSLSPTERLAVVQSSIEAERDATMMQQLRERKPRILPIRLDQVDPPYLTAHLAYVDIFPDDTAFRRGVKRLVSSIAAHLGREAGSQERQCRDCLQLSIPIHNSQGLRSVPLPITFKQVDDIDTDGERWLRVILLRPIVVREYRPIFG